MTSLFSSYWSGSPAGESASASGAPATGTAAVSQVHPPKERLSNPDATFGPLTTQDTSWLCAGGFATETQVFYGMTGGKDSKLVMAQVIHSAVGMWYPQIQFTFRYFDPATGHKEWRSVNVTGFTTGPTLGDTQYDKRSAKSNEFSILLDPAHPDTYSIEGKYDDNTEVSFKFKRAEGAPGWKLGTGPRGGMTYFGAEKPEDSSKDKARPDYDSATDGYVVHRFWPRCHVSGIVRIGNEIISLEASSARGIFIHAIQGMRPNLVACRWNFGYFNSDDEKQGASLAMMEFTTPSYYGNKTINVGSIVVDDKLVAVIADGSVEHLETDPVDEDTSYNAPSKIRFSWKNGRSLLHSAGNGESPTVDADLLLDLTPAVPSKTTSRAFRGLIEKVDVLAEIPYLVKKVISYVAGTKPYIYQFHNTATATISLPSDDGKEIRKMTVNGHIFNEATFISPS